MKKYTFPLTKSFTFAPIALMLDKSLMYSHDGSDGMFLFKDGKSCDVHIAYAFRRDDDVKGLDDSLVMAEHGNAIVSDGANIWQIAYKQTSPKS